MKITFSSDANLSHISENLATSCNLGLVYRGKEFVYMILKNLSTSRFYSDQSEWDLRRCWWTGIVGQPHIYKLLQKTCVFQCFPSVLMLKTSQEASLTYKRKPRKHICKSRLLWNICQQTHPRKVSKSWSKIRHVFDVKCHLWAQFRKIGFQNCNLNKIAVILVVDLGL